jgi:hypothetical protein
MECGRPCRGGYALDLGEASKRFSGLRRCPSHHATWVPDRGMATMIAQSVLAPIAPHRRVGLAQFAGESASGEINLTTFRLYPGAVNVPHDQLKGSWPRKA